MLILISFAVILVFIKLIFSQLYHGFELGLHCYSSSGSIRADSIHGDTSAHRDSGGYQMQLWLIVPTTARSHTLLMIFSVLGSSTLSLLMQLWLTSVVAILLAIVLIPLRLPCSFIYTQSSLLL